MGEPRDIAAGRLSPEQYRANFADVRPPLSDWQAAVESARCLFCFDAPCVEACPTAIDVPGFIHKIATGNVTGAAIDILSANIFGGSCARVCPTEVLCERACVRNAGDDRPVEIGRLQRFATDHLMRTGRQPFTRKPDSGRRVAVVGAGPAGLACAHRLATLGHGVTVIERRDKLGGLNEYGIAAYKLTDDFAQREIDFILAIGGIEVMTGTALGRHLTLDRLRREYDAVFLGTGLTETSELGVEGERLDGVVDAVAFIDELRQATDPSELPVGRRVIVVGGGNTAIDAAVQSRLLGAEDVSIVYRRGPEHMRATGHEQELAKSRGVHILFWAKPTRVIGADDGVAAVEFERTTLDATGRVVGTGRRFTLEADTVFKAIGQTLDADTLAADSGEVPELVDGRIRVDDDFQTTVDGLFAGGDCIAGLDLTVEAVRCGKLAAEAIDRRLANREGGPEHG
jgi:glutamate synthase (NADPH/NADH) small chain